MVNIGKGIFLKLLIFCPAELRTQSLSCQGRKPGASHTQNQGNDTADNHLQTFSENILFVPCSHSNIYQVRHNKGNDQLKNRLCTDTDKSQQRIFFILMHIGKKPSKHSCTSNYCIYNYCMSQLNPCQSLPLLNLKELEDFVCSSSYRIKRSYCINENREY